MARPRATDEQGLVNAAAELFVRNGYKNVSIDALAESVGVTKRTVYRYTPSKAALLERVFTDVVSYLETEMSTAVESSADPAEQLRELIRRYAMAVIQLRTHIRIFLGEETELPAATRRRVRARMHAMTSRFAELLQACGWVKDRDLDAHVMAQLIFGMMASVARWYSPEKPRTTAEIVDHVTTIISGCVRLGDQQKGTLL